MAVKETRQRPDKIHREYDGDASKVIDLAGAKITYRTVADAYDALRGLMDDPRLRIVRFDDRLRQPTPSGYRDLQLSVRMPNGHVAELRLYLCAVDAVSD